MRERGSRGGGEEEGREGGREGGREKEGRREGRREEGGREDKGREGGSKELSFSQSSSHTHGEEEALSDVLIQVVNTAPLEGHQLIENAYQNHTELQTTKHPKNDKHITCSVTEAKTAGTTQ